MIRAGAGGGAVAGLMLGLREVWRSPSSLVPQVGAVAAVLAPLLLLYSLRYGVVTTLTDDLARNPASLQIVAARQGVYPESFFSTLRADPRVGYVVPHATPVASQMDFTPGDDPLAPVQRGTVLASARGDPYLSDPVDPPSANELALSATMAVGLGVGVGDAVTLWKDRVINGRTETLALPLKVSAVVDPAVWDAKGALIAADTLWLVEMWQEGYAVPSIGFHEGASLPVFREYRNFRLFARDLPSVRGVLDRLSGLGVEGEALHMADYDAILSLDQTLGLVFLLLAGAVIVAFLLVFGAAQWAAVDRRRHALSILRLHGLTRTQAVLLALGQSATVAIGGWFLAAGFSLGGTQLLNVLLGPVLSLPGAVSRLDPLHLLVALVLTVGSVLVASILAVYRITRIEPGEGIRNA